MEIPEIDKQVSREIAAHYASKTDEDDGIISFARFPVTIDLDALSDPRENESRAYSAAHRRWDCIVDKKAYLCLINDWIIPVDEMTVVIHIPTVNKHR